MRRTYVVLAILLTGGLLFAAGGWLYMKTAMHGFSARADQLVAAEVKLGTTAASGNMSGMKMDHSPATPH